VVIDAVRCAKLALDRDVSGTLEGPSAYFMKSPAIQHTDEVAREMVEAFIRDEPYPSAAALDAPRATPPGRKKDDGVAVEPAAGE
jgi:myo-inositol-1-phosphate synthase